MKKICIFLMVIFGVFACDAPFEEQPEMDLKSGNRIERTIKFQKASGVMEVIQNMDACTATGLQMIISGGGNATFLGNFTVYNKLCIDGDGNPVSPIWGELTAANGDKIYTMVNTDPWVDEDGMHYLYKIREGMSTGRFEGATGYIDMYGIIDHINMTWDLKGEGMIKF
ncbi:hypothetical protein [Draconibacterium halophilum]|uniref:Uncharacterized protein n=1 Tax=Draconibacterium halophilum TaxID=2706887 RepID=A0A6C0RAV9_9BACT|nr:hypothetical protein [Draconibacterium halophilum]QIA07758.1 hypothetical protein G0Q07_08475 [Draconibacterium halophilum]